MNFRCTKLASGHCGWVGLFVETVLLDAEGCTLSGWLMEIRSGASQRLYSEDQIKGI